MDEIIYIDRTSLKIPMENSTIKNTGQVLISVTVRNRSSDTVINAAAGVSLLEVLLEHGLAVTAECGGRGTCKKCLVRVQKQGLIQACRYVLEHDIKVILPMPPRTSILESSDGPVKQVGGDSGITMTQDLGTVTVCYDGGMIAHHANTAQNPPVPYGVAVDIGTTTVVVYLEDLAARKTVAVESFVNPQAFAGSDVVSRINFAMEHETGLALLQQCIVTAINKAVDKACTAAHVSPGMIFKLTVVGNPTMLHLLLGVDPAPIARAPYVPLFTEAKTQRASMLGLTINPGAVVMTLPLVAGYVGADVIAGIASTPMMDTESFSLYIDIGTNGEMALGNRDVIFCCASAAGPAFEGARIRCGVSGIAGAICSYEDGSYTTIGGLAPVGICGSGVVDIVARLLDRGIIDADGFMESDVCIERSENTGHNRDIVLTPADVREVQLAKAAIASGIKILIKQSGVRTEDIGRVYLAGAFGNYMRIASAARIGMMPPELVPKVVCVGNAAGTGACLALRSREFERSLKRIVDRATYIELSGRPDFNDIFIEEMAF
jgi:uncharacterized 2Fe-2S/4Fe-4S cluster protein (DUF4445 family)